jgi:outer membrane biosynthesis protein TonB
MAAFMLFAVIVSGCKHKTPVSVIPVAAQAPPPPAKPIAQPAGLPPVPQPEAPNVAKGEPEPPPKPKRTTRHKPKPTPATTDQAAKEQSAQAAAPSAEATQQASAGEAPAASPIGQLTTTGESTGTPSRHEILDTIEGTEKGLNDLKRTLTPAEQETTVEIRTFLAKAKQALNQDDLDGAHTQATKAKVLLEELVKG